jgi:hypothetical protein
MNPSDPQTPEQQRIQSRNQKALEYIHMARDKKRCSAGKRIALGIVLVVVINLIIFGAIYFAYQNLGEL